MWNPKGERQGGGRTGARPLGVLGMRFCSACGGTLQTQFVPSEGKERPVCQVCGQINYLDPKVSACTIPFIDGRVLLSRRAIDPGRGLWVFPGGYMERGETVPQAAERETFEEVDLRVRATRPVGVYSYVNSIVVVVVYHCEVLEGQPTAKSETMEIGLFGLDEIPWGELAFPSTREALKDFVTQVKGQ